VAWDVASHIALGVHRCLGPCQDSPQFLPVIREAAANSDIAQVLADKGYDAEHDHARCREELKIPSSIISVRRNTNGTRRWPTTRYRREMKLRKNRDGVGQRWQAESAFSAHKRVLGTALRARTWLAQKAETFLRVLTHNLLLLASKDC
jgi:IS5 family transposase